MSYPIQPVSSFGDSELYYIYQQLIDIANNTSGSGGGGATQEEIFEIFNGTNPEGEASSLFATYLDSTKSVAQLLSLIRTKLNDQATASNQTTANSSLSSIDTKLSSQATASNQTTGNASLLNIETALTSAKQAEILSTSTTGSIAHQPHNISFYNSGSAAGTLTVNGTAVSIPAGVSVNYDAGGNGCKFAAGTFSYNATGTTFIISYVR